MLDTSFIKPSDLNSIDQVRHYTKSHKEYYDIKPIKKGNELVYTKEQEKLQLKIIKTSLKLFKDYFVENCKHIVKNIKTQVKQFKENENEKLRIKKQLFIQIFESELSYLKEIVFTPKIDLFLRKHIYEFELLDM